MICRFLSKLILGDYTFTTLARSWDLSLDDRKPPGCPVLLQTISKAIYSKKKYTLLPNIESRIYINKSLTACILSTLVCRFVQFSATFTVMKSFHFSFYAIPNGSKHFFCCINTSRAGYK